MRAALVLVYWADRLDAVVCSTRPDVLAGLHVLLGSRPRVLALDLAAPPEDIAQWRERNLAALCELWLELRQLTRRRPLDALTTFGLTCQELPLNSATKQWQLLLGSASVPDPAMLIRRVLNGQDPERHPPLPRIRLRRRPLCLLGTS
jgi:hypothetical protein